MSEKRLYLSNDKVIAGVAGGVAEYLGVDPTIVRLIWAFSIFTGAGIIAYIIGMILIPEQPKKVISSPEDNEEAIKDLKESAQKLAESSGEVAQEVSKRMQGSINKLKTNKESDKTSMKKSSSKNTSESNKNLGILLLAIGVIFLMRNILPGFPWGVLWPVAFIIVGIAIVLKGVGAK